ncbi:Uma2 family endonuclease [filamentous cyanobacterium LEGE 11480]|uniref:Uma2 family endonuclease n=1 Tax=Romeriopsis navalis LEGE 11480 TaxID=2777977 RepID=A0A928VMG9_9CYAN|nr:Uma2 family endonuclease [Romeriopsis navalis]MBE9029092.1 Uma2 family endonuclease [Romeriopsis navalis LEGE 11480]
MTAAPVKNLTLADFLHLPYVEESPAWEYVDGVLQQKPMPKTRHSMLQKRLLTAVDAATEDYTALPELRCTFGGRSTVPDVAVVVWERIPVNDLGEPEDHFTLAPDWTIEILSPDQKATRVIDNILHCLKHGCRLGWMLDPDDYAVFVFQSQRETEVFRGDRLLPMLEGIDLSLTAEQIFSWLQVKRR